MLLCRALVITDSSIPELSVGDRLKPGQNNARFLLTLNDLDEFGFQPGIDSSGY